MSRRAQEALSPMMLKCLAFIKGHGLSITRHPGGFWAEENWKGGPYFGTTTVEALVKRHMLFYDQWQESSAGKFPIRATMTEKPLDLSPN